MSAFAFRAVDAMGVPVRGEIDAGSQEAVVEQLRGRGLTVLEVSAKSGGASWNVDLSVLRGVKSRDLTVMTRQLSTMVSSGLTLLKALYVLEEQTETPKLKAAMTKVRQDVEAGRSLSDSLAEHPKIFSPLYVSMVRAGETGGFLESALLRVADQLESEESLKRQVRSAMVYPAAVISFALVVMFALVAFIVPVFAKIFEEQDAELPTLTKFTVGVSDALRGYPWAIVGGVVLVVLLVRRWKRSETGREQWDRLRLRIPLRIGEIQRKVALARWSRTLSSLVSAGVPMLEAIDVTGRTAGNTVVEKAMASVRSSVQSGGTIAAALRDEPVFPVMVSHMVGVGEETGALDQTLAKVADFYEDEVSAAVKALTSILEPAMIVLVGAIVGFVVISMYLPMFQVYDKIE
ncbi:MAG TPA: type II secretion system F family protein [Capillimicrobium sp.]|nr:type II secretion system F family protein [Capillimicrobium sp.]